MKYTRITYEVWPLEPDHDDPLCWVPSRRAWLRRSLMWESRPTRRWQKWDACAEARTFARAKWTAKRYPGAKVRILRYRNDQQVRSWTLTRRVS